MVADWRAGADAAEQFFGALGMASVDQRVERIAAMSRAILNSLQAGFYKRRSARLNRWTVRQLDLCARTFCRPMPPELVELVEFLLGVACPVRDGQRKNIEKFRAAIEYVARNPDATDSKISRAIKYDQKAVIRRWRDDPQFQEIVEHKRARILHRQNKGT